jgi:hypothetical protein
LVTRTRGADPRSFAGRRVATFFAVDDAKGEDQEERYHLYQEWHAS